MVLEMNVNTQSGGERFEKARANNNYSPGGLISVATASALKVLWPSVCIVGGGSCQ